MNDVRSTNPDEIGRLEIQFLTEIHERSLRDPSELPRARHIARHLGLQYREAVDLVNRLHDEGLLVRAGRPLILSQMRVGTTSDGYRAILRQGVCDPRPSTEFQAAPMRQVA